MQQCNNGEEFHNWMAFTITCHENRFVSPQLQAISLSEALIRVVDYLEAMEFQVAELNTYVEGKEYGDSRQKTGTMSWQEMVSLISSSEAIFAATPTGEFQYVGIAPEAMSWYLRFGLHGDEDKLGNLEFAIPVGRIPSFTKWMRNAGDWVDDAWFWTTRGI